MINKMTLKQRIEWCLRNVPETRNSDIALTVEVWKRFYPEKIQNTERGRLCVELGDLYDLPREDNVKRTRAQFNTEGLYWSTDLKVAIGRGIQENEWRVKLGYPRIEETKRPTKEESYTSKVLEQKLL